MAATAIARSISHNEIVTAVLDADELAKLVELADESCDTGTVYDGHYDIWTDDWRVFVVEPTAAIDRELLACYDAAMDQGAGVDMDEWEATAEDIEWVVREVIGATTELVKARLSRWHLAL